ncbi:hypothetical protein ACMU_06640 [Actibacterium mucosum KCTC 23349]|uniref:Uncharacterized protein n=1 Tax=Actibacterium mucosum KCTC 23349 TaxID=1454373 RepID=A0A037ZP63_9RHOB|nr:hypothetical protein [Actibacterium mucosum]KAJ56616.1 hypothetical protein ACMU_06640 [Actibacterium mucosum KCTC 23349]
MEDLFRMMNDPGFLRIMQSLSVVCLFLGAGCVLVALAFYSRARDQQSGETDPWIMLFATLRDMMLVTLIYVAAGMVWRFGEFAAFNNGVVQSPLQYAPLVSPVAFLALDVITFTIAILRVIAIGRWINARMRNAAQESS